MLRTLGFRPFDAPIEVGGEPFHLAALDFGPDSVDGWLNRIAAAELGESDQPFLDERDRSVDLGGARIQLSPLEFGVLNTLAAHPAAPVSRADLLREVWGTSYDGGSNTVDAGTFDISAHMDGTAQSAAGVLVVSNNSGFGSLVQQAVTVQANVNVGGGP